MITPYNLHEFTKEQLQEENVRRGGARCANELRSKTEAKFLALWNKEHTCHFTLDGVTYELPIPTGKTKKEFIAHILSFFSVQES
jgi:hypothetical protein